MVRVAQVEASLAQEDVEEAGAVLHPPELSLDQGIHQGKRDLLRHKL